MNKGFFYTSVGLIASIVFSFTSLNMASLYMLGSLGGSVDTASYTVAIFGIANASSIPLALTFGGRFGRKIMIKWCLILFILATYSIGLAPNFPTLLVIRFLQGFFSGPLLILLPSLLTTLSSTEERLNFTRTISVTFITISIIATCVGGTIAYEWSWRWLFLVDGCIPTLLFFFLCHHLKRKEFPIHDAPFDWLSYFSFFISLWSLSLFIILAQQLDWFTSPLLVTLLIIFLISFPFCLLQSRPHLNLLKSINMIILLTELAILFGIYYGMMFLLGIWLRQYVNYTPNWIALVLGCMLASASVVMFLASRLKEQTSKSFLILGLFFLTTSSVMTMYFNAEVDLFRLGLARVVDGIGLALFLPPLLYRILTNASEDHELHGLALFHITRTIGSGLGISLFATTWQRREVFYHLRLGGQLTPFSDTTVQFFSQIKHFFFTPDMSKEGLSEALSRQSAALALCDCFYLMAIILGSLLIFEIIRKFLQKDSHRYIIKDASKSS